MNHLLKLSVTLTFVFVLVSNQFARGDTAGAPYMSALVIRQKPCMPKQELTLTIREFSEQKTYAQLEQARLRLEENARLSSQCRSDVIGALMEAMDKPEIDLLRDFHLWRYGADLLGKLKASESLDLLIKHLNLTDGTSINVSHYPAMGGVMKFGGLAIPKLSVALEQNSDREYLLNVIFCIGQIGGSEAVPVLQKAFNSKSDACVRRFIQVSIDALNNSKAPGEITLQDRDKWFAAFACNG